MGKLTDDMTRLCDEMQTMAADRADFIKKVQDDTRELLGMYREEIDGAHEVWSGRRPLGKK